MAKQAKQTKTPATPVATPAEKPATKSRGRMYALTDVIAVSTGENERRTRRGFWPDAAITAMKQNPTVAGYLEAMAKLIETKGDMPGRGKQPPAVQANALLRFLEKELAVSVRPAK